MRIDIFMLILAIILIAAMLLTLLYGKSISRHGYGVSDSFAARSYA